MSRAIHSRLVEFLQARGVWEERQRLWYEMLHDGIPRRSKPFPGAANLHLPLADNAVQKLKPYYVNSVFSRQRLASFTVLGEVSGQVPQGEATAAPGASSAAADCLDWKLRKESNFPKAYTRLVHLFLGCGRAFLKIRWDTMRRGGRLAFEAIDPLYFIGDAACDSPQDMDLSAHVKQMSVEAYKRVSLYSQDAGLIEAIRGGDNQAAQTKEQEKDTREGISGNTKKDVIVLWETYERTEKGFVVRTFSPTAPDREVHDPFTLDLMWQGEPLHPIVEFSCDIEEAGLYAPRGIPEKVAAFEAYGTKQWNEKADWLAYANKPLFERAPEAVLGNTTNITLQPGTVLPAGVRPSGMPAPPYSMDEEINMTRQLAEESAQTPDFGAQQTEQGKGGDSRTATEWNYIGTFASQGIQYKAFISGMSEGEVYLRCWALLLAAGGGAVAFYSSQTRKVLPQQALHDNFLIEPDAQPDAWNKEVRIRREFARFQLLRNDPRINQDALYTRFLSAEDPRLAKELYLPQNVKASSEAEDEALEIGILLEGYPAAVLPGEDHQLRLRMLFGKLQQLSQMPAPQTMEEAARFKIGRQRMQEHIAAHMAALQQENPALARQFSKAIQVVDPGQAGPGQMPALGGAGAGPMGGISAPVGSGAVGSVGSGSGGLPGVMAGQPSLMAQ